MSLRLWHLIGSVPSSSQRVQHQLFCGYPQWAAQHHTAAHSFFQDGMGDRIGKVNVRSCGLRKRQFNRKKKTKSKQSKQQQQTIRKQAMQNTIAHHPLTNTQPIPKQWQPPQLPSDLMLCMMPHGMGFSFGQPGPAVLVLSLTSSLCPPALHCQGSAGR